MMRLRLPSGEAIQRWSPSSVYFLWLSFVAPTAMRLSGAKANVEQYSSIVNPGFWSAAEEAGKGNAAIRKSAAASISAKGAASDSPHSRRVPRGFYDSRLLVLLGVQLAAGIPTGNIALGHIALRLMLRRLMLV